jgi:hypothetical protein
MSDTQSDFLLAAMFPALAAELQELLVAEGRQDLADQVPGLKVVDRCRCGDYFCATIYTRPRPRGAWGPGHECIPLDPKVPGMIILDTVDGAIAEVEILDRGEIRKVLLAALPDLPAKKT